MRKKFSSKTEESATLDEHGETAVDVVDETSAQSDESATTKSNLVSRAVYGAFYGVSYGVVFSSLLVQKLLIPKNSLVDKALHDGAVAAQKAIEEKEELFSEVAEQTREILSSEEPSAEPA